MSLREVDYKVFELREEGVARLGLTQPLRIKLSIHRRLQITIRENGYSCFQEEIICKFFVFHAQEEFIGGNEGFMMKRFIQQTQCSCACVVIATVR